MAWQLEGRVRVSREIDPQRGLPRPVALTFVKERSEGAVDEEEAVDEEAEEAEGDAGRRSRISVARRPPDALIEDGGISTALGGSRGGWRGRLPWILVEQRADGLNHSSGVLMVGWRRAYRLACPGAEAFATAVVFWWQVVEERAALTRRRGRTWRKRISVERGCEEWEEQPHVAVNVKTRFGRNEANGGGRRPGGRSGPSENHQQHRARSGECGDRVQIYAETIEKKGYRLSTREQH